MSLSAPLSAEAEAFLSAHIAACAQDPLEHVLRAYRWGEGPLAGLGGPRDWQADILREVGDQLRTGHGRGPNGRLMPVRIAVASGHGIGKSALIAFLAHWAWSTCTDARVVVTANTGAQLRTKTWPEIAKWYDLLLCKHWFTLAATSMHANDPRHRQTWRVDQVTWSEHNAQAFAGLHNKGRRIVVLFDEASTIPDKIWDVTEGALTDADTEIVWIAFGNPTRNTGRFRECWGRHRELWTRRQIDSRTVPGTNAALFEQWVKTYGEDSDFVRIRVKGAFPRAGSLQFIGGDLVDAAMEREAQCYLGQGLVLGVDVARFGDDRTVIQPRRGLDARTLPARSFHGLDTMQVAARVMEAAESLGANAVFVDEGGVGAGVVDRLRQLRCPGLMAVNFGARADRWHDGTGGGTGGGGPKFANKRAEIWGSMKEWLRTGAIADETDLKADLTGVEYGFNVRDEILLEAKDDMKARGLASPDLGDALALTFAYPVADVPRESYVPPSHTGSRQPNMLPDDWRPYDDTYRPAGRVNMLPDDWEPYRD